MDMSKGLWKKRYIERWPVHPPSLFLALDSAENQPQPEFCLAAFHQLISICRIGLTEINWWNPSSFLTAIGISSFALMKFNCYRISSQCFARKSIEIAGVAGF
jgi:hypothetical protein